MADVIAAVSFTRENELVVVRGGGHSVPGYEVCEGGIVIDLTPMKGIWVERRPGSPACDNVSAMGAALPVLGVS